MYGLIPFRKKTGNVTRRDNWDIGSMIDDFFNNDLFMPAFMPSGGSIRADIKENEKEFIVEAELPGVKKDEIKLDLEDDTLTIGVERNEETKDEKENYIRRERRYGSYSRCFHVQNIKNEEVKAEYNDGILKITLPKLEEEKAAKRKIDIE